MLEIGDVETLRSHVRRSRRRGASVGLVPTMGYLHAGHLALAGEARRENDLVVMSIFVNPTQFGPAEDLDRYPRNLQRDRELAEDHGVDVLFVPDPLTMYPRGPDGQEIWVEPGSLAGYLEGASRPGHFRGVSTVVAKLFNIVQPDRAYFGQKDAQQALIVSRMVEDLAFPLNVRIVPTQRDLDGVALSSRNVYLTPQQRAQARALPLSLRMAQSLLADGERDVTRVEEAIRGCLAEEAGGGRIEYVTVADLATLRPIEGQIDRDALVALAVNFGSTRLIDNFIVRFEGDVPRFS